jgi:hypothetical protein
MQGRKRLVWHVGNDVVPLPRHIALVQKDLLGHAVGLGVDRNEIQFSK